MTVELVVLVDERGAAIGTADKATVHGPSTPRHLAFSCYGFDPTGRLLITRRSRHKRTFPLLWTNTCCGHPEPGEDMQDAVRRRMRDELGLAAHGLQLVLPEFGYRASLHGIEEHELCPVFVCALDGDPRPAPDEVEDWQWWDWDHFLQVASRDAAVDPDGSPLSPWARLQAPLLAAQETEWRALRPYST